MDFRSRPALPPSRLQKHVDERVREPFLVAGRRPASVEDELDVLVGPTQRPDHGESLRRRYAGTEPPATLQLGRDALLDHALQTLLLPFAVDDGEVVLETKAIVVAAGCGSKRFLEGLVGQTAQTELIKHRRVHMICVRAPRGALPTTSVVAMPVGLLVAAHDQPDNVTWYVTPMEMGGPSSDDIPGDAAGEVDPEIVSRGWMSLLALFPRLPEVDGIQIGCYAGYRQDIGDRPGNRMCELVAGTANVIVALPSGLIGAWLNATTLSAILGGLFEPSGAQPPLPSGGVGVRVDVPVEDRQDFVWMGLEKWSGKYVRAVPTRSRL